MTFKTWFEDMQKRYQSCYNGYEELLQEAFEAGAKQEREACAKLCEDSVEYAGDTLAQAIRARGQA